MNQLIFNDYPLYEVERDALEQVELFGAIVYQKFTCEKCGSRQAMQEPNKFFTRGQCEECGHITDLRIKGCNYLAIFEGNKSEKS